MSGEQKARGVRQEICGCENDQRPIHCIQDKEGVMCKIIFQGPENLENIIFTNLQLKFNISFYYERRQQVLTVL